MSAYKLINTIVSRTQENDYLRCFKQYGIETVFSFPCRGTASKSVLAVLGIENDAKTVLEAVVTEENAHKLRDAFITRMGITLPGAGIAFTIPLTAFAGKASKLYLCDGQEDASYEGGSTVESTKYALITVIIERGFSDMVMDAARRAGAKGGTIVHAKGTAGGFTLKFFGVSIAAEKEILQIVARREDRDAIMNAIMEKAGPVTSARAAVYSLPVDEVIGLCSVTDEAKSNA